jgi:hypothetical protein
MPMAQQVISIVFFFVVGAGLSYLVAKRIDDLVVAWIAIVISATVIAAFAILFSGDLYRAAGRHDMLLVYLLAIYYRLMADGLAAILAGGIAGTLVEIIRRRR